MLPHCGENSCLFSKKLFTMTSQSDQISAGRHVTSLDEACDAPLFTHWTTPCNFSLFGMQRLLPQPSARTSSVRHVAAFFPPAAEQKTVTESDKVIK